jgi:2-dehydropantoate 2-reductase
LRIGVIGGGAIGLLISAYLASKHHLTVYTKREDQKQKINKHGIFWMEINAEKMCMFHSYQKYNRKVV